MCNSQKEEFAIWMHLYYEFNDVIVLLPNMNAVCISLHEKSLKISSVYYILNMFTYTYEVADAYQNIRIWIDLFSYRLL